MLTGVLLATVLILGLLGLNWSRAKKKTPYELTPNCLLTRYPLVFLTGRRSLFYFLSYWNEIPDFLTAHGYQVYVLPLPWKASSAKKFLLSSLQQDSLIYKKFHFFVDSSFHSLLTELSQDEISDVIASITCIDDAKIKTRAPWWWGLHLLFTRQPLSFSPAALGWPFVRTNAEVFLSRATTLAETDLIRGDELPNIST